MEAFAHDTRHRKHQMEDFDSINLIARKFLATQCPKFVDWKRVYPWISSDLSAIEYRAPGMLQEYANYRTVAPKELKGLLQAEENLKEAKKMTAFRDYCEKVKPPKGQEVLLFFLHGQKTKNLSDHLEAFGEDKNRLFDAIRAYQLPKGLEMQRVVEEMGNFLRELKIASPEYLEENTGEKEKEEEEEEEEEEKPQASIKSLSTPEATLWNDQDHWENPILKAFKVEQGLSTVFPTHKCVKQMIVAKAAPTFKVGRNILGKTQSGCATRHLETPLIQAYVNSLPSSTIEACISHPSAQEFYHSRREKPQDNRDWVNMMIQNEKQELSHEIVKILLQ